MIQNRKLWINQFHKLKDNSDSKYWKKYAYMEILSNLSKNFKKIKKNHYCRNRKIDNYQKNYCSSYNLSINVANPKSIWKNQQEKYWIVQNF